jgi:hypothetical protein
MNKEFATHVKALDHIYSENNVYCLGGKVYEIIAHSSNEEKCLIKCEKYKDFGFIFDTIEISYDCVDFDFIFDLDSLFID